MFIVKYIIKLDYKQLFYKRNKKINYFRSTQMFFIFDFIVALPCGGVKFTRPP